MFMKNTLHKRVQKRAHFREKGFEHKWEENVCVFHAPFLSPERPFNVIIFSTSSDKSTLETSLVDAASAGNLDAADAAAILSPSLPPAAGPASSRTVHASPRESHSNVLYEGIGNDA